MSFIRDPKQKLIDDVRRLYDSGKFPTCRDFKSRDKTLAKYFSGSFENVLAAAGIPIPKSRERFFGRKEFTRKQIVQMLSSAIMAFCSEHNRIPNYKDLEDFDLPHSSLIHVKLGRDANIETFIKKYMDIHYEALKEEEEKSLINELKEEMVEIGRKLGRTPTSRDLDEYSLRGECRSASTYLRYYGNMINAQIQCGFDVRYVGKMKSDEDLLNDLRLLYQKLGRPITGFDIVNLGDYADVSTYNTRFGTWTNALEQAGLPVNVKYYMSPRGLRCKSWVEYQFATMLENKKIPFDYEVKYRELNNTINTNIRLDFVIFIDNNYYYIELFGINQSKKYDQGKQRKIKLCESLDIPLIYFDWHEITKFFYNMDTIYDSLLSKISSLNKSKKTQYYNNVFNEYSSRKLHEVTKKMKHEEIIRLLETFSEEYPEYAHELYQKAVDIKQSRG